MDTDQEGFAAFLCKGSGKRESEAPETSPKEDAEEDPAAVSGGAARLARLEALVCRHHVAIRSLEAWSMQTWLFIPESERVQKLQEELKPKQKAPWRRCLAIELVERFKRPALRGRRGSKNS